MDEILIKMVFSDEGESENDHKKKGHDSQL